MDGLNVLNIQFTMWWLLLPTHACC